MKQEDRLECLDTMENEILDHKKGGNWSIVHRRTLQNNARPIKAILSFKREEKARWQAAETQRTPVCAWGNAAMG